MRLKLIILTYIFISGFVNLTFAQEVQARFQHFTASEGFTSATVYGMFKDSRGFMWFCSTDGLYRYDGYDFKVYYHDPEDSSSLSKNDIYSFCEDKSGTLWFGSGWYGLNKYDRSQDNFKRYYPNSDTSSKAVNGVMSIYEDRDSTLMVGTPTGGLIIYDKSTDSFTNYRYDAGTFRNDKNFINSMHEDTNGNLWLATRGGLLQFNKDDKTYNEPFYNDSISGYYRHNYDNEFIPFRDIHEARDIRNLWTNSIFEDENGVMWFGTGGGLLKYNPLKYQLTLFEHNPDDSLSLSSFHIKDIQADPTTNDQHLWIGSYWGLNYFNKTNGHNVRYYHDPSNLSGLIYSIVHGLYMDANGLLWIANENNGVSLLNLRNTHYEQFNIRLNNEPHTATTFCHDNEGNIWVGTRPGGLFRYDENMNLINNYSLLSNYIYSLHYSYDNQFWLGTMDSGLYLYDHKKDSFVPCKLIRNGNTVRPRINSIFKDSYGYIWAGSTIPSGLFYHKPETMDSLVFQRVHQNPLEHIGVRDFYEDKNRVLWIATHGEGVFKLDPHKRDSLLFERFQPEVNIGNALLSTFTIYSDDDKTIWFGGGNGLISYSFADTVLNIWGSRNGLEAEFVYDIVGDGKLLWLSTDKGLIQFDPEGNDNDRVKVMRNEDGVPFENIYTYDIYRSEEGMIYVGGKRSSDNGFYRYHPDNFKENKHIPPIVLTDFQVNNKAFNLDTAILEIKQIHLNYLQNYFSFEFAALDYVNPERNLYAYMLEGVDDDWIYSGNRHFANYTGVPPGDYVFRVKGSNNDGYWNEEGTSVQLIISPPPWKTWWAYVLYGLTFIALLYFWRRYDLKRQHLKKNLEIEQVEAKKLKELDKLKSQFFANISHEFRTPLTLILGPLEKFRKKISDSESVQDLNIMQRNALRLQKLINQLLSLSKIESGQMKLQAWEEDIVSLTRGYVQSFESLAQQQNIHLTFNSDIDFLPLYIDRDKIEKILYNLLSNALKFTKIRGEVNVLLGETKGLVTVAISDTGTGIEREQLEHIFDRFYRADNSNYQEGTGIGLALAKELVELHHGKIEVESEPGRGTTFTVFFPKGKGHLKEEELVKNPEDMISTLQFPLKEGGEFKNDDEGSKSTTRNIDLLKEDSNPVLLIVEDNEDLRRYIRSYFENDFQIIEAKDGVEGFEGAIENLPDIIISDVMMPNMDGFELCQKLKGDQRCSHIPLILLTARASTESKMEGLETGADDFITKPFDPAELQVRVKNLIDQRKRLAKYYMDNIQHPDLASLISIPHSGITQIDKEFLKKAVDIIVENMAEPEFNLEEYSSKIALSRVQLHRKLKGLLNMSPGNLIRLLRLKRAAELLKKGAGNVTEIAFEVGFNNLSYFAKCFHEEFGCLPSEYFKNE